MFLGCFCKAWGGLRGGGREGRVTLSPSPSTSQVPRRVSGRDRPRTLGFPTTMVVWSLPGRGGGRVPGPENLRQAILFYVTQGCFRAVHRPSGPDFGRTATGKTPKLALRPAFGRPEGRCRCFPGSSPAQIQPGRPISVQEALMRNIREVL